MAQVGNLARYIRRVTEKNQSGEGNIEGGVTAFVDLMGIGRYQNLHFRDDGDTFEEIYEQHGEEFSARVAELIAMDPQGQNEENQRGHYNQAINEVFGPLTFHTSVLLKRQAQELERLSARIATLEAAAAPAA